MNHLNSTELNDNFIGEQDTTEVGTWVLICIILGLINVILAFI